MIEHRQNVRRALLAIGCMATVIIGTSRAPAQEPSSHASSGAHAGEGKESDFAFLEGEWRVHHRYIRVKADGQEWVETDGTCSHRELKEGWANVEDYVINRPGGVNRAAALRSYDSKTARWTVWWLDQRYPTGMEAPMQGGFENGVGTFYGNTTLNGKPVRVRFIWSDTASVSPRWQQAYSYDDGKTWETVWIMQFERAT